MKFTEIQVTEKDINMRLDRFLRHKLGNINQTKIEQLSRKKLIKVNGIKTTSSYKTKIGDKVEFVQDLLKVDSKENSTPKHEVTEKRRKFLLDSILYQDDNIVIINKPVGLAVQGGSNIRQSIDDMLDVFSSGYERPKLTHRLDKETTGILVIAKTRQAAAEIAEQFKKRTVTKIYWGVCKNVPNPYNGIIKDPIIVDDEEKRAETRYTLIDKLSDQISLLEFELLTGRKHQIRIHASKSLNCPILGDEKYGGEQAFFDGISPKQHLHARKIIFHNLFGKKIEVTAPIPDHIRETFRICGFE